MSQLLVPFISKFSSGLLKRLVYSVIYFYDSSLCETLSVAVFEAY